MAYLKFEDSKDDLVGPIFTLLYISVNSEERVIKNSKQAYP